MAQMHATHRRGIPAFWRHFLEMLGVMAVGMILAGYTLVRAVGLSSWDTTTIKYPNQALLAMVAGMTLPMVGWMLYRGMGRRNAIEMGAAMALPVIPFFCLVWFHATKGAQCGGYCALSVVAMLGLMLYRKREYSMEMTDHSG